MPRFVRGGGRSNRATRANSPLSRCTTPASSIDAATMFDVLVKRIHEYKRQHLQVLHIVSLYHAIKSNPALHIATAHVHLRRQGRARLPARQADHQIDQFRRRRRQSGSGRQRPPQGYFLAEFQCHQRPAAISSGRFVGADLDGRQGSVRHGLYEVLMNGAVTIGTLDGANIEIRDGGRRREFLSVRPQHARSL
jgi:glycogen phosphorylase